MLRALYWRGLALTALSLGAVGVVLPGLPTVPFLLLAAWAGSKGWPQLEAYLLGHPTHGPLIRDWRERGAVPRRAKWLATLFMSLTALLMWHSPMPPLAQWGVSVILLATATWLWCRPET